MNRQRWLALGLASLSSFLLLLAGWIVADALQADEITEVSSAPSSPPPPTPPLSSPTLAPVATPVPSWAAPTSSPRPSSPTPAPPTSLGSTPPPLTLAQETTYATPVITPSALLTTVFPYPAPILSTHTYFALDAGHAHTCALTLEGGVECWGNNSGGQLGDGTFISRAIPSPVSGLTNQVRQLATGDNHTCALLDDHRILCWGENYDGQLGNNHDRSQNLPVEVVGLTGIPQKVVAGASNSCAITLEGELQCWGRNFFGQLGDGSTTNRLTPIQVGTLTDKVQDVAILDDLICALSASITCWGFGIAKEGQRLVERADGIVVTGGSWHGCLLNQTGALGCWDDSLPVSSGGGALVRPALIPIHHPLALKGVSAGARHTCFWDVEGGGYCWGENKTGQLGDGTRTGRTEPGAIAGLPSSLAALAAGGSHSCALTTQGYIFCWGDNANGQLGNGIAPPPPCEGGYECWEGTFKGIYILGKAFFGLLEGIQETSTPSE